MRSNKLTTTEESTTKIVMSTINNSVLTAIFILNTLYLIFGINVSLISLILGENVAILIINILAFIICKIEK